MKKVVSLVSFLVMIAMTQAATTANFDDLTLAADSYWSGNYTSDGVGGTYDTSFFNSGSAAFENHSDGDWFSWGGFAYSNMVDTTTAGYMNQYSVYAGSAHSGSNFAVGYQDTYNGFNPTAIFTTETLVSGLYVTNSTYAALDMINGSQFSDPFDENDSFVLTITGKDASGQVTNSVDFALASGTNVVNTWEFVDLSDLGVVKQLEFTVSSTDYGTPTYFAVDTIVPEPSTAALLGLGTLMFRRKK